MSQRTSPTESDHGGPLHCLRSILHGHHQSSAQIPRQERAEDSVGLL